MFSLEEEEEDDASDHFFLSRNNNVKRDDGRLFSCLRCSEYYLLNPIFVMVVRAAAMAKSDIR